MKDILPGREGHVGGTAADNRLFVEAVRYRCRAGIPWPDLPARFGAFKIIHQRFGRWAKSGVFDRILNVLAADADKAYDSDGLIGPLVENGITPVIPPKRNRKTKRPCDFTLYKERNLVERVFNKLKQFRAIATRYDKTAMTFLAGVKLAAATILLKWTILLK